MSSAAVPIPPGPSPDPVFRLSVEQYHAMIEAGVLTEDDPVELLEGMLIFKMPKSPKHRITVAKLDRAIRPVLPSGVSIQLENPVTLPDGEPEPDVALFRGLPEDFQTAHPGPGAVELIVEVSDTTLARDRGIKLQSYARCGITNYWIVDLNAGTVEVYAGPTNASTYSSSTVYRMNESIPLRLAGRHCGDIKVSDILP